ncbi:MAG: fimbrillin family protein [Rikenellaceae bacterium]
MRNLILASAAVIALASCSKESTVDVAITSSKNLIEFTAYASSASTTKGTPINSNTEFQGGDSGGGSFDVSAYFTASSGENSGKYFGFNTVTYTSGSWVNATEMYWPNEAGTLGLGAFYPSTVTEASYSYETDAHSFKFTDYVVADAVASQVDLMYAVKAEAVSTFGEEDAINLHFKHALTQIAFTATKDDDITVTVSDIQICNVVNKGTFTATESTDDDYTTSTTTPADDVDKDNFGEWEVASTGESIYSHYAAAMADGSPISVTDDETAVALTSSTDALMLLPQELEAWDPTAASSTNSFLAIKCTIMHTGDDIEASIVDGYVFVPFSTDDIEYTTGTGTDGWLPGYKITYNLHFGGGYTLPDGVDEDDDDDDDEIPDPGKTPDPDDVVETLRPITYTISVDEWINVAQTVDGTTTDGDVD